jgi:hypothetical protein
MVWVARRHLTIAYARGARRLMWDTEKRPLPDAEAIAAVLAAAGHARMEDLSAALVLIQAQHLDLDRAEFELIGQLRGAGVIDDALAAMLELPGPAQAAARYQQLKARYQLARAEALPVEFPPRPEAAAEAARRARLRAEGAATRTEQARQRIEEVHAASQRGRGLNRDDVELAHARAAEARLLAAESADRTMLGLLRVAERLEASAAECQELAMAGAGRHHVIRAVRYLQEARRLRDLVSGHQAASGGYCADDHDSEDLD